MALFTAPLRLAARFAGAALRACFGLLWDNRLMTPQSKGLIIAIACASAVLGAAGAFVWRLHASPQIELAAGTFLSPQRALPDFSLIDQRGQTFGPANLGGHWSFVFFGYTNCPDVCPTTLTTLAAMEKKMRDAGASIRPRVVFVSVDAKRDTPEQLAKYVPYFDPEFTGVTAADQKTIEGFARKLGVAVAITPITTGSDGRAANAGGSGQEGASSTAANGATSAGGGDAPYTVEHSSEIFVIDPRGKLAAVLTGPFTPDGLRADFQRIASVDG
jgi:protein SCO1